MSALVRKRAVLMSNAAIYARVSSARQKEQQTIGSQTAALQSHAEGLGLDVPAVGVRRRRSVRGEPGPAGAGTAP